MSTHILLVICKDKINISYFQNFWEIIVVGVRKSSIVSQRQGQIKKINWLTGRLYSSKRINNRFYSTDGFMKLCLNYTTIIDKRVQRYNINLV